MKLNNYANTLTVKGFDVRMKDGMVHLKDLKKLAKHLGYDIKGKSPKAFFASEEGAQCVEVAGKSHINGKYASQFLILKYSDYVDTRLLITMDHALSVKNSSYCSRVMAAEAQSSMLEALSAAGGDCIDLVDDLDFITELAIGCTASEFIEANKLPEECRYMEYLTDDQIAAIDGLTRLNTTLIEAGVAFSKRREKLKARFASKNSAKTNA